jgi:exonuclease SbcD
MKLLHTGDWHVGRTIHKRQRLDESREVLDEVCAIAIAEQVDVMLVCGDVYENHAPSAAAEQIVYETLLRLSHAGIPVVIIAGNHDYARRLSAVKELLRAVHVHVVAEPTRPQEGGIIEIQSRDRATKARIAALPWVSETALFGAEEMMGLEPEPQQAYAEQVPRLLQALCESFQPGDVNVLVGHLFVSGARVGDGERDLTIGQTFAITAAALPTTPQYIALGHVHRPQQVPGAPVPARYAGSVMQMDFGESGQGKSVSIVEVEPGQPAKTREAPLTRGTPLIDLEISVADLEGARGKDENAYARVYLQCDGPAPGLLDDVREVLPNAVEVRLVYEREDAAQRASELKGLKPQELFVRYFNQRHGADPDDVLMKAFGELLEQVTTEART